MELSSHRVGRGLIQSLVLLNEPKNKINVLFIYLTLTIAYYKKNNTYI